MIVIPMAGLSKRFAEAGYLRPKYMLPLGGKTVFDHAVESFRGLFDQEEFLFIVRDVENTPAFVESSCSALGLRRAQIATLEAPTGGQAETVELGLHKAAIENDAPLTIFNIDTFRRGFCFPTDNWFRNSDGYLEVFRGDGANWSYVRPSAEESNRALETAEKRPISDLCCTGLYHFAKTSLFMDAFAEERRSPSSRELYVAPLYNHLINKGARIHYQLITPHEVVFCGVPDEYRQLLADVENAGLATR
jgi:NDP-sugar pyrophosphorylase family protein